MRPTVSIGAILAPLLAFSCTSTSDARVVSDVATAESVAALDAGTALAQLKEGNLRFVTSSPLQRDWKAQAEASMSGAHPYAAVLTSSDARVPGARVFDAGIGDIAITRTPGPLLTAEAMASLEASVRGGVRVVAVLTHSDCAEICSACGEQRAGAVLGLAPALKASIDSTPDAESERIAVDRVFEGLDFADSVAVQHARGLVDELRARSTEIRAAEELGHLRVVAGYYDLGSGAIAWLP